MTGARLYMRFLLVVAMVAVSVNVCAGQLRLNHYAWRPGRSQGGMSGGENLTIDLTFS